jgi:hypothetical protein
VAFAEGLKDVVAPLIAKGFSSRLIAQALNEAGTKTSTGGQWSSKTVIRLIERLSAPQEAGLNGTSGLPT